MIFNTLFKKAVLAVLIAISSVAWLNAWHHYGFSRRPINFPQFSSWWRDAAIILLPVMLAVWLGIALAQALVKRFGASASPSTHSFLIATILGGVSTFAILLAETSKLIQTGIGIQYSFLTGICRVLYPGGNIVLKLLEAVFPEYRSVRYHILLQDGLNLILVNLAVTVLLILILEVFANNESTQAELNAVA